MANTWKFSIPVLLFLLLLTGLANAQSKNNKTVVGTVGSEEVTYGELITNFSSGSQDTYTLSDLKDFLPIYLNYKAKLMEAREKGYFQDSTILAENKVYTKQAAYAFWLEQQIKPTKFDEYYKRATTELKTAHLLINLSNPSEEEIQQAIDTLNKAREELLAGADFEEINEKYSSKRQGRSMGGTLPWLSVGRTVKSFEDVVYNLEVGEISKPFKTRFGYHVAMLLDKRERSEPRRIKHIFVRATQDSAGQKKIDSAFDALQEGRDWKEVTMQFSEDTRSSRNEGDIGWVDYSSGYDTEFAETIMNLDPEQDYTQPILTNYGYHIFKVDSVRNYSSEEEKRKSMLKQFEDTPYFEKNNSFVINFLREKYDEAVHENTLSEYKNFITSRDTTLYPAVELPEELGQKTLYEFRDDSYDVADYHSYLQETKGLSQAAQYTSTWFDSYVETIIDEKITELTKSEFPEFADQVQSYISGLVIYKINDDSVWSAATVDTSALESIYENNVEKYSFDERHYYHLISARHDSTLQKAINFVNEGNSPDSIRSHFSKVAVVSDSTNTFEGEPYNRLDQVEEGTFSEVFNYNKRKAVFYVNALLPERRMTFDEAFNRLLADYQPEREEKWLNHLREKYSVKAHIDKLEKAYNKDPKKSS